MDATDFFAAARVAWAGGTALHCPNACETATSNPGLTTDRSATDRLLDACTSLHGARYRVDHGPSNGRYGTRDGLEQCHPSRAPSSKVIAEVKVKVKVKVKVGQALVQCRVSSWTMGHVSVTPCGRAMTALYFVSSRPLRRRRQHC